MTDNPNTTNSLDKSMFSKARMIFGSLSIMHDGCDYPLLCGEEIELVMEDGILKYKYPSRIADIISKRETL